MSDENLTHADVLMVLANTTAHPNEWGQAHSSAPPGSDAPEGMTEERLREIENGAADPNLKMWDFARGTIEELCVEVRRLQKRDAQWRDKWMAAVDTAESWMAKAHQRQNDRTEP